MENKEKILKLKDMINECNSIVFFGGAGGSTGGAGGPSGS